MIAVAEAKDWLDVGCGTGALVETILAHASPNSVVGIDLSPRYVDHVEASIADSRATFDVADAQSLPFETASLDVAVSGLVLNFVPQPPQMIAEMTRVIRRGGTVGVYVWDYAGKMEMMRFFWDAAVALDAAAMELDEGRRFPLCQSAPLAELFEQAGLDDVQVRPIDVVTEFRNFDDYWLPFLGGQGPAPGYAISLDEQRRAELRDRVRSELPIAEDGSIRIIARAWAASGRKQ